MRKCIDSLAMLDHLTGNLSGEECKRLEKHLAECEDCLEEFVGAYRIFRENSLIAEEPIPESDARSLWQKILPAIKEFYEWVKESPGQFPVAAYSPVRGSQKTAMADEMIHFQKNLGKLQTEMIARKTKGNNFSMEIRLPQRMPYPMRLNLKKEGFLVCSRLMAAEMLFIEKLPFGNYSVTLTDNNEVKGSCHFEISEAGVTA